MQTVRFLQFYIDTVIEIIGLAEVTKVFLNISKT